MRTRVDWGKILEKAVRFEPSGSRMDRPRMSLAIRCCQLVKTYPGKPPVEAVRGVDLEVRTAECFGVLGPNGAGKTTAIEILEGLLPASSGEVEVLGLRWGVDDERIRQAIGVSLQETQLSEKMSVLEALTLFRSFYRRGIEPREAIARVSPREKAKAWAKALSGGRRRRLCDCWTAFERFDTIGANAKACSAAMAFSLLSLTPLSRRI